MLFAQGRHREVVDMAAYLLQSRLEDDYWVEVIPLLVRSAAQTGALRSLLPFMVEQSTRVSLEYPDETSRFQASVFAGLVQALIDIGETALAGQLVAEVGHISQEDTVLQLVLDYTQRIAVWRP